MSDPERTFEVVWQECMDAMQDIAEIFRKAGEQ